MAENLRPGAVIRPSSGGSGNDRIRSRRIVDVMRTAPASRRYQGFTLGEIVVVVVLTGILASMALVPLGRAVDRAAVRAASDELMTALAVGRQLAIMRSSYATATVDTLAGTVTVECSGDTVHRRAIETAHGVVLAGTRTTIRFSPNGLGYGVSNLRVIARRRSAADTVYVSRAGRARRA